MKLSNTKISRFNIAPDFIILIITVLISLVSFKKTFSDAQISVLVEILRYLPCFIFHFLNIISFKNNVIEKNTLKNVVIMEIITLILLIVGLFTPISLLFKGAVVEEGIIIFQSKLTKIQEFLNCFSVGFSVSIYFILSTLCQIINAITRFVVMFVTKTQNKS